MTTGLIRCHPPALQNSSICQNSCSAGEFIPSPMKFIPWWIGRVVLQASFSHKLTTTWVSTTALISLHWLRVPERISFKLAVMTYRSIHGTSPSYLQSCFIRVAEMTSRRRLRSSTSHRLDVLPVRLSTVGRRAFPVSGATVWNDLPIHVASVTLLAVFRQRLKDLSVFPFLPRHYHMTRVLLSPFLSLIHIWRCRRRG